MARARAASRSREGRAGPYTLAQGLGPDLPFDFTPGARLSLTTASPVAADATAQGTLYLTEFRQHAFMGIPDGRRVVPWEIPYRPGTTSRELALSLAGVASGSIYDVFLRVNGGKGEMFLGPAWTTATAGAGARAAAGAITRWRGLRVLAADPKAVYLGTILGSGTGTVDDSGVAGQRYLWNQYNRVQRKFKAIQASSWNYTLTTIRSANGVTGEVNGVGRVSFVVGFAEDEVECMNIGYGYNASANVHVLCGIGLNRTTADDTEVRSGVCNTIGSPHCGRFRGLVPIGLNYLQAVEASQAAGTSTFFGASAPYIQAGLSGSVLA